MAYVNPDKQPGAYPSSTTVKWTFDAAVNGVVHSVNGLPPVVSEYIAYDQLDPPTPFIAVTQDGKGNVVYDGGFPKYLNSQSMTLTDVPYLTFAASLAADASAPANTYHYDLINNDPAYVIKAGDKLIYDMYPATTVYSSNFSVFAQFALDATIANAGGGSPVKMRDLATPLLDQNGVRSHPSSTTSYQTRANSWINRQFDLTSVVGKEISQFTVAFENQPDPTNSVSFRGLIRSVRIVNSAGATQFAIFTNQLKVTAPTPTESNGGWMVTSKTVAPANSTLNKQQLYFRNCLDYIANPTKVAAGNKKILVLGDTIPTDSYRAKSVNERGFLEYLTKVGSIAGYAMTVKETDDYSDNKLNPTLAELNQYAAVLLISSASAQNGKLTPQAVQDLLSYRQAGNGIFIITDHGPDITSLETSYPLASNGFFATANQLSRNFSAYFTGSYDRSNVSVGYLRTTYGDHALYKDLLDTDFIQAGGSESQVVVKEVNFVSPSTITTVLSTPGKNTVDFLVRLTDGTVHSFNYAYFIAAGKLVIFRDNKGIETTSLNVGMSDIADITIEIDGSTVGSIVADIMRYDVFGPRELKVGEAYYDPIKGSSFKLFTDDGLYVNNADVIRVKFTTPFAYTAELPITRWQYVIPSKLTRAENTWPMRGKYNNGNTKPYNQMPRAVIEEIHAVRPGYGLNQTRSVADHFTKIIQYSYGELPKAPGSGYAYVTSDIASALTRLTPPTPKQIFETWDRFFADRYYPGGTPVPPFLEDGTTPNPAARWYWDDVKQSAVQPDNSSAITGFISDEAPEKYVLEVTCQSDNADDDFIGVVMAFVREGNENHHLTLALSRSDTNAASGGSGRGYEAQSFFYDLSIAGGRQKILAVNTNDYNNTGWSGAFKRVRVERNGDLFTVKISKWDTTTYDPALSMTIDLNSDPLLAKFKGGKKYGYLSFSQPLSYFKDINYSGLQRDVICDMQQDKVYGWNGTSWAVLPNTKVKDVYGAPRIITSFEKPTDHWQVRVSGDPVKL